jgi:small subunit ribosomal protein S16
MSVVIRLMRAGAKKRPFYRMVAADSRRQRDGRFLEILGHYNPLAQPFELVLHKDLVEKWLSRGAQPSTQAASLLRSAGMPLHRAPQPKTDAAESEAVPAKPKAVKKAATKKAARRVARPASERQTKRRADRKAGKIKPKVKAAKKKS